MKLIKELRIKQNAKKILGFILFCGLCHIGIQPQNSTMMTPYQAELAKMLSECEEAANEDCDAIRSLLDRSLSH
jgi:hypothetical protein